LDRPDEGNGATPGLPGPILGLAGERMGAGAEGTPNACPGTLSRPVPANG
jgi:hypothetical protein